VPFTWNKLSAFLSKSMWDLLVPGFIEKPVSLVRNFYECFLVAAPEDRKELLQEVQQTQVADVDTIVEEVIGAIAQQQGSTAPPGGQALTLAHRLIDALREAGLASQRGESSPDALRRSLDQSILAAAGQRISPRQLSPDQRSLGRLLVSSVLHGGAAGRRSGMPAQPPPVIPGYAPLRLLGSGGFADVYLMRHETSGELRAVKVVRVVDDPRRLARELDVLRKVRDEPHLVSYRDDGQVDGVPWIAMEHVGDTSLAQLLAVPSARPTAEQALLLGEQVLRGLAALHARAVIHRDLKPDNIMIDDQFRLRLIDFGLAKPIQGVGEGTSNLTRTAAVLGTPYYMSLEQLRGKSDLTPAADLWSFGVVLYELFTGSLPFQADSFVEIYHAIMSQQVNLEQGAIPGEVRPFLGRCLEREAAARFADAGAALRELLPPAEAARRRLRHERYRTKWAPILQQRVLEQFVLQHNGRPLADAVATFVLFAATQGVQDVDEVRLAEVLPAVFVEQQKVEAVLGEITNRKQRLAEQVLSLPPSQIQQLSAELVQLEARAQEAKEGVTQAVRQLLKDEARAWEDIRREEADRAARAERERQEAARQESERQAAALRLEAQRQQEARRRAEADRARAEAEAHARDLAEAHRRAEAALRRRRLGRLLGIVAGCSALGALTLGGVGWLIGVIGWTTIVFPLVGLLLGGGIGALAGAALGAVTSSYSSGRQPCCEAYQWGPVSPEAVKGWAIICGVLGCIIGGLFGIDYLYKLRPGSVWEWSAAAGAFWGGMPGAVLGMVVGLLVAAHKRS
jgi:hypothetical protein